MQLKQLMDCVMCLLALCNSGECQAKKGEFSALVSFSDVMLKCCTPFTMAFGILLFDYT